MVERILSISRVQKLNHYDDGQQSFNDSLERKPQRDFQSILEEKIKAKNSRISDPYCVSISKIHG